MKKLIYATLLVILVASLWIPSVAVAQGGEGSVNVILQTDGSTDDLATHIRSLGGTVKFQYRNVPALAAAIPASRMDAVAGFSGVTKVEKDSMVYLHDGPDTGKNAVHPLSHAVENMEGIDLQSVDAATIDVDTLPEGYTNFLYTGAYDVWFEEGIWGDGTIVAVVDTGTVPNTCIGHAIIGTPDFPEGYNATGDGIPATDPSNYWHGTHVGGVIASSCALDFSAAPTHPIWLAVSAYLPWDIDFVPVFGQAPEAQLYPVKVFPTSGAGVPTSIILDGLDHVLTLKKDGLLDIDIVNMSLGGPTVWDGRDTFDRFITELEMAHILVVASAGNEGPIPNSVGSPATSFSSLDVGALDYALSSSILYEYLGLAVWPLAPGQGMVMRPTAETRVVNYSSRGPLSDGRAGPDIVALGHWNFHEGPNGELRWAGGTSFSAPTVAGGAALLNAYWENVEGKETAPAWLRSALVQGANPNVVGEAWQGINDQGWGALDVPAALEVLKTGHWQPITRFAGFLKSNVLPWPRRNRVDAWESDTITLSPSEPFDAVFSISRYTSKVTIEVFDIEIPDNWDYAYWPNALEVHVQSAKRTGWAPHPVEGYWYPWYGDSFDIVIEDGSWSSPWGGTYQPMEPGLMKLSLIGDYSNEAPVVSFKVRITRENFRQPLRRPIARGIIKTGEAVTIPVDIPAGVTTATFDLDWLRKWNRFPTSDIDMIIYDPDLNVASFDGATGNAPERVVIANPAEGTWYVYIEAYEVYRPDPYKLYLTIE